MANINAIRPFWHKARRTWVPLTMAEWFQRGASQEDVTDAIKDGTVKRTSPRNTKIDLQIYEVTSKGRLAAVGEVR